MTCHKTIWIWLLLSATALAGWHTNVWDLQPGYSRYRAEVDDVWFWYNRVIVNRSFLSGFAGGSLSHIPECSNSYQIYNTYQWTNTIPDPDEVLWATNYLTKHTIRTAQQAESATNPWAMPIITTNIYLDGMCADDMTTKTNTDYFANPYTNVFHATNWFAYTYDTGGEIATASNAYLVSISHSRYGTNYPITMDAKNLMKYDSYYALKERGVTNSKPEFYYQDDDDYLQSIKGGIAELFDTQGDWITQCSTSVVSTLNSTNATIGSIKTTNVYLYLTNMYKLTFDTNDTYTGTWFNYTPASEPSGYFEGIDANDVLSDTNYTGGMTNMLPDTSTGDYGWRYVDDLISLCDHRLWDEWVSRKTETWVDAITLDTTYYPPENPPSYEGYVGVYDAIYPPDGYIDITNEYGEIAISAEAGSDLDATNECLASAWVQAYYHGQTNFYTYEYNIIGEKISHEGWVKDSAFDCLTNITVLGLCNSNPPTTGGAPGLTLTNTLHLYGIFMPTNEWFIVPSIMETNANTATNPAYDTVVDMPMFSSSLLSDTNTPMQYPTNVIGYPADDLNYAHTNVARQAGFRVKKYNRQIHEYDFEYE